MGLPLWKKKHILRRFRDPEVLGGYETHDYDDMIIQSDVQTTDNYATMGEDGDEPRQSLKMFSDCEICVADTTKGILGDQLWFQGKWFECRSSVLSENTFLRHYTSTFVECPVQNDPPELEVT